VSSEKPWKVVAFIILLCTVCGAFLATASYTLKKPQEAAKEFDQSKQMLIAAGILTHKGNFQLLENGSFVPAIWDTQQECLVKSTFQKAKEEEILSVAKRRISPLLVDEEGNTFSFAEKNMNLQEYLQQHKKEGFSDLPLKLAYAIVGNGTSEVEAYVLPVSGFGLWAPLYGYIALENDGNHVRGTTWYDHGETPGLGANITEAWWQEQFYNKEIFQGSEPVGITVVKGKVADVYGNQNKGRNAVDGMSGATLTGDGVTAAYKKSLAGYRRFLIRLYQGKERKNRP
jgi:Na+-transporting NADH:ubiquinone oxidoreductase subunit C